MTMNDEKNRPKPLTIEKKRRGRPKNKTKAVEKFDKHFINSVIADSLTGTKSENYCVKLECKRVRSKKIYLQGDMLGLSLREVKNLVLATFEKYDVLDYLFVTDPFDEDLPGFSAYLKLFKDFNSQKIKLTQDSDFDTDQKFSLSVYISGVMNESDLLHKLTKPYLLGDVNANSSSKMSLLERCLYSSFVSKNLALSLGNFYARLFYLSQNPNNK